MELSTTLAVTGLFVQVLFDRSLTILGHGIQYWAAADPDLLPDALVSLRLAMNDVLALLPRAKSYRGENQGILEWLKALKDAAYDADDLLSELEYYRLQQQVEGETEINDNNAGASLLASAGDFLSYMLNTADDNQASTSLTPSNHDSNKANIVSRINKVVGRLDRITMALSRLLPLYTQEVEPCQNPQLFVTANHPVTTSKLPPKLTVFGRDKQRDHIIELLLTKQIDPIPDVAVLPIVGIGGVGKTTLARMVYENKRVTENFDCMLWLYVSSDFDVARLTREMLQCLKVPESEITNVDLLQRHLTERLCSTKFLLVLDDVWNDAESLKWDIFCAPLVAGRPGSRVLMTTRLHTVVRVVRNNMDILGGAIELNGLPEDDYLSLFYKCAYDGEEPRDLVLTEIGRQIAVKLNGNPLAAKTVGGMLKENLDHDHWRSILSNNLCELEQSPDDIMPVLKLSYQHLRPHLQQCFAYCSVFPKNWNFDKDELVMMWISHGYINTKSGRLEDVGGQYFEDLFSRSFFQASDDNFVIHDLLHDLAASVSGEECFRLRGSEPTKIPRGIRHLFARFTDLSILERCSLRNIRTLIISGGYKDCDHTILEGVLKELRSVRVLFFFDIGLKRLPVNIDHLIHLRYIDARSTYIDSKFLPDSWCMLYHLQWLGTRKVTLPVRINNLISLRRYMNERNDHFRCVSGIGKLTSLQVLAYFTVGQEDGQKLAELKNLNGLRGSLSLRDLQNVTTKKEALDAELSKKVYIQKLTLIWSDCQSSEVADEVIQGLRPPSNIQKMKISRYCGVKFPAWMMPLNQSLSILQSLKLHNCINWKDLPPIGELPLLKKLEIEGLESVEEIGSSFYGIGKIKGFPCLEILRIRRMPRWVAWSGVGGDYGLLFPSLQELELRHCPMLQHVSLPVLPFLQSLIIVDCRDLQSLPLLPASLVELNITLCDKLQVATLSKLTSLEKLTIEYWPHFMSLSSRGFHQSFPLLPPSLEELHLGSLDFITNPKDNLSYLTSLQQLTVRYCPLLLFLPLMPASLEVLHLDSLDLLTVFTTDPEENMPYLTSLRQLKVRNCPLLQFLPILPPTLEELHLESLELQSLPLLPASLGLLHLESLDRFTIFTTDQVENLFYLTSLHMLTVRCCPLLQFLPLPASIIDLEVGKCDQLLTVFTTDSEDNLSYLTSLKILTLTSCPLLQSLPLLPASPQVLTVDHCDQLQKMGRNKGDKIFPIIIWS